ncbi:MAG: insulinase family protein [Oceanospirillaceae bacterium]|uniref:M16 family metallopeptidase n=1 Tax=Marinobacterium litorale TaxID=404770 RepID=UPI00041B2CDE|nr:pitrilysin family protein [Marinobacterium litorale]MBS97717.1 insulinase family protein [Oceanospirillaceae bacterium]
MQAIGHSKEAGKNVPLISPSHWARMAMLGLLVTLSASALSAPDAGPAVTPPDESVSTDPPLAVAETFVLDNGLQVVVIPRRDSESVLHMVWYKTGAADDPPGQSGLAHFVEHLTFGSMEVGSDYPDFHKLERQAVQLEAYTSYDQTVYYQDVSLEALPLAMSVEARRMRDLDLTPEAMASERREIRQERSDEQFEDERDQHQKLHSALYPGHPYSRSVLGGVQELAGVTAEDAKAYHRQWYAPNNAVLIMTGPVRAQSLRPLIQQHYGDIPARPLADRRQATAISPKPGLSATRLYQHWSETLWIREYLAPSYVTGPTEHTAALQVLAALLGGDPDSRLHRRIVGELGLARDISVTYEPASLGMTPLTIEVTLSSREDVARVVETIDLELNRIRLEGPFEAELERAKRALLAETVHSQQDRYAWAQWIGTALTSGLEFEELSAWPERISKVTQDDVRRSVNVLLPPHFRVTAVPDPGSGCRQPAECRLDNPDPDRSAIDITTIADGAVQAPL